MDTDPDDLRNLEQRLAACAPASAGLDADAVLFAAGRASVRPGAGRLAWASLAGLLAALSIVLGVWLAAERRERLELAQQIRQLNESRPTPSVPPADQPPTADQVPASSPFAIHQLLQRGLDGWPEPPATGTNEPGPPSAEPSVFRVGRPDSLPDL